MPNWFCRITSVMAALFVAGSLSPAYADLIKLNNGGEVRGRIVRKPDDGDSGAITLETLTGATVVVDRQNVQFVTRRSLKVEQYETLAKRTPRTVSARWELAEWCRENGLTTQREEQLHVVLELDPEHERAHYGLKHTKHDGKWITRDELMTSQGYVKHTGRYVTTQELELIEKTQAELDAEGEWYKKVRLWFGWLTGRHAERQQLGLAELQKIDDPDAVPALMRLMQDHTNKQVRELYVKILSRMQGNKPVEALVTQSLHDADHEIRFAALGAISPDQHAAAVPFYVRALKNDLNAVVCRAAAALQRVGEESTAPDLIEALVTTHRYRMKVPDNSSTMSFGTDGSFGQGAGQPRLPPDVEAMLLGGQLPNGVIVNQVNPPAFQKMKTVVFKYDHRNAEVLSALRKLTGQNFGYNERTWRLWRIAKKNGLGEVPALP